jgi:hypothetical protein
MFGFSREQRRTLKTRAGTPRGLTEHLLIAHDVSVKPLSGLVHAQLAAVVYRAQDGAALGTMIMVERAGFTDAGRMALAG